MARFREIDFRPTPMGDLILRERWDPVAKQDLLEIKLGDEFLMSSLFTVAEIALGHLATAECDGTDLDVVVGGLGLGCTALAVLEDPRVRSLVVVDALPEVIEWHREHLIPAGTTLTTDARCRLVHGDFFAGLRDGGELNPDAPGHLWHAVVVDIDHTPTHHLHPSHADLYDEAGLNRVVARLHPGGVFALWSDDPPDETFMATLAATFPEVRAEVVTFDNPLLGTVASNTVYLARTPR
ncbi:spermidine synthase [Aeromicrobium sp. A1-2]|uniref:spermidine synthase n=1 Tax=Aeromicrobium sp. A1-2 TaxID=2107713 RepID=UPI000E4F8B10|nr:spermidine synthase [Aeromicrobium sp. A1-2]AXT86292.1 spermidine synthase [Aeromicrobium sp. A1-2]